MHVPWHVSKLVRERATSQAQYMPKESNVNAGGFKDACRDNPDSTILTRSYLLLEDLLYLTH
jgi:hypothetical protein